MQWPRQKLINHIVRCRIDLRAVIEEHADVRCPFLKDELALSVWIMSYKRAQIEFANVEHFRPGREIELENRRLIVDSGYESHLCIEVLLRDAMARVNIEPVVGVSKPSA